MSTVSTNIRMDAGVKKQATELFSGLGMTLSEAVNIFCRQAILRRGLPFRVEYPKAEEEAKYKPTKELLLAVEEAKSMLNDPNSKRFKSTKELFEDLNS